MHPDNGKKMYGKIIADGNRAELGGKVGKRAREIREATVSVVETVLRWYCRMEH